MSYRRNIRNVRSLRGRRETLDRNVTIDWSRGPRENLKTMLSFITKKDGITIGQRLSYLHFYLDFCSKMKVLNIQTCGFSMEDILCCLRVSLFHKSAEVRAAGLRAIRHCLKNELSADAFYRMNLQLLVARSLDIELNNSKEREESLRLIRKLLSVKPDALPEALCRSIVAIARDGCVGSDKDRMRDACMGCLCEITLLNPKIASRSGGISALLDCILMSHESMHISDALISCILYVLNDPRLRCQLSLNIDLRQFIAPFTDCHYSMPLLALNTQRRDDGVETVKQRENRLNAAKIALVSVARSWAGIFALCKEGHSGSFSSPHQPPPTPLIANCSSTNASTNHTYAHHHHIFASNSTSGLINTPLSAAGTSASSISGSSSRDIRERDYADDINGLCSLIEMLNLPYTEIRKHIMELIFELFFLSVPKHSSDFQIALDSCHPASRQNGWHLLDGFVASEGKALLPHIAKHRQNLIDNYLSLLLYTFLTNGLLDALVSVITLPSDAENSVRAIILVGELLHLSSQLLPPELAQRYYTLPKLIEAALSPEYTPEQHNIAKAAITCLNHMHNRRKYQFAPHSLYLNQLIHFYNPSHRRFHNPKRRKSIITNLSSSFPASTSGHLSQSNHSSSIPALGMASISLSASYQPSTIASFSSSFLTSRKEASNDESTLNAHIRESHVLKSDASKWDWDLISCVLKSSCGSFKRLDDSNHRSFSKKIINYFKPSSKLFSQLPIEDEMGHNICTVGCYLIDFLLEADESRTGELIGDFLNDIGYCINQITAGDTGLSSTASDAILNPRNALRTWSQAYFLFIGRFTGTAKGSQFLEKAGIYQSLIDLIRTTKKENYFKLIVSSLNYSKHASVARSILAKILACDIESARLYATKYLRVLLRIGSEDFRDWALELLSQRLSDDSQAVVLAAIDVLEEACDLSENLEALISLHPSLMHVGDRGLLLLIRYLSLPSGFKFLRDTNFLDKELHRWKEYFNCKYVKIVEDLLNEAFTTHQRGENGTYGRRSDKKGEDRKTVFVPAHLYGELVKQEEGYNLVVRENFLGPLCEIIRVGQMTDEVSILQLKAALWAIGSVGASSPGFKLVSGFEIIPSILDLASKASVLSIRGTCFYVLGMLASTENGADHLKEFGWQSVRDTPCYVGISLPTELSSFLSDNFHQSTKNPNNNNNNNNSSSSNNSNNNNNNNNLKVEERLESYAPDRFRDFNNVSHEGGLELHTNQNCLLCSYSEVMECRTRSASHGSKETNLVDSVIRNMSEDSLSSVERFESKDKRATTLQEPYFASYASSSPDTRLGSLPRDSEVFDIAEMRRDVIRSVSYLLGWMEVVKIAEQGLLNLKQKYPSAFLDVCLYSEISLQLASYNFRLSARRFLQELFMDVSFDQIYPDVESIYERNSIYQSDKYEYPE
ncbi:rapamycin-insensitive companion of Tor [Brevipalpus obovatus]|uniref:rapamycin-insensitive companion of Tor n=1 Tax=Brevipalpus obovatus TaxID=246614 RepID=UPI003D9F7970